MTNHFSLLTTIIAFTISYFIGWNVELTEEIFHGLHMIVLSK